MFAAELKRRLLRTDEKIRDAYLRSTSPLKLHIGAGWSPLDGWLNTDLGRVPGVMKMDATKPFPFQDDIFDFIYSEHMIEHVPFDGGVRMLAECYRVLKPHGVIRLVTPDLTNILALAGSELSPLQTRYLTFFYHTFLDDKRPHTPNSVINAQFRCWGHAFLYDEAALAKELTNAGFIEIKRSPLASSAHAELNGIANERRYDDGLLDYESLTLEARKPADRGLMT